MKTKFLKGSAALVIILTTFAFTTPVKKSIDVNASKIVWVGEKVTGSHTGNITLKEGHFNVEDGVPVGGEFVMNMASIDVTDLRGENKGKLERHLQSDDFFSVSTHPTSKLVITKISKKENGIYGVAGNLTIKNETHPITFDLNWKENTAAANLTIDRSKYNVRYGSGSFFDNLGDKTIYDNFELAVNLKF